MASESVELLFKFLTQGTGDVDKAAAGVEKLVSGSAKGSAPIDALGKALGGAQQQSEATGRSFDGLADKIRNGFGQPLQTAGQAVEGFFGKLGMGGAIALGVGAGLGAAAKAAFDLIAVYGKAAEETVNLADRLDITAGAAERLQAQAKISSVNIGTLEGAARLLSQALEDPAGQGAKTAAELRKLGIQTVTTAGQLREPGPILLDLLDKLGGLEKTSERVFAAQQVLPKAAVKELVPLIKNYAELKRAVDELGVGIDEGLTQNLAAADDEIDKMEIAWERLKKSFAGKIAPIVVPIVVKATKALNGELPKGVDGSFGGSLATVNTSGDALDVAGAVQGFVAQSLKTAGAQAQSLIDASLAEGRVRAQAFGDSRKTSEVNLRAELAKVTKEAARLESIAASAGLTGSAQREAQAAFQRTENQRVSLEQQLNALEQSKKNSDQGVLRLSELLEKSNTSAVGSIQIQLGLGEGVQQTQNRIRQGLSKGLPPKLSRGGDFVAQGFDSGEDVGSAGLIPDFFGMAAGGSKGDAESAKAFGEALLANLKERGAVGKAISDAETAAALRLVELTGNEYDSAKAVRDLRLATAQTVVDAKQAELDYTVRIAELDKARLDRYKETAAGVYRSIRQRGGGGIGDLLRGQLDIQGEKIFSNVSGGLFQAAGGALGKIGAAIPGGEKLFEGTILDPRNAQKPVDRNTQSLDRLRVSVDKLTGAVGGGGLGGMLSIPGVPGAAAVGDIATFASDLNGLTGTGKNSGGFLGKLFSSSSGSGSKQAGFFGGVGSVAGGLFKGFGGDFSVSTGDGSATTAGTAGRIGNVVGSGALVAGGALGIISGIREGGARGLVGSIGSALGVAAAIPGPQQPFIAAAALVAGVVKGLIPSGKETFGREQDSVLASRRFTDPTVQNRDVDLATGGDSVDYDWRGRSRVTINKTVIMNVDNIDAKSLADRRNDLADAFGRALDDGHPAAASVQKVIFGAAGA